MSSEKLPRRCGIGTIWQVMLLFFQSSFTHSSSNLQELADVAFRLSDDTGIAPSTARLHQSSPELQGPISSLTHALTTRPKLRTFCTLLPSLWNESILRISSNPNLECIVLGDGASRLREQTHVRKTDSNFEHDGSYGIVGTGLFLMQARKHARLSDLIRAGTYVFLHSLVFFSLYLTSLLSRSIMRTRAQTLGNASSPSSSPPRSHSPASPYINCVRSHNVSSGSFASSSSSPYQAASASTPSTSQKHRQQQYAEHHHHHHHPNMTRFDSTSSSRASYGPGSGSGAAPPQSLPRSLVASASGSLNGHCLERFAYRLADS